MINYNGKIISSATPVFHSTNRVFKYGDGLFETIKVQNLKVNFLEDHYFRLMASMRMLRMEIPMSFTMDFFENELIKTVQQNNLVDARLRMTVYRKDGGLYTPITNEIDFIIEASSLNYIKKREYEVDLFKDYFIYSGYLSTVKSTNKSINVLASIYASENEFDNCILLNEKKHVVEAINGNVFLVKGNTIKTPAITEGCVKGIVRKKLIEIISKHINYTIEETSISPFEIQKADEIFITNAIVGIQSVIKYKKTEFKIAVAEELALELKKLI
jgi:branched-chain amino acid aminotransferase